MFMISKLLKKNMGLLALCLSLGTSLFAVGAVGEATRPTTRASKERINSNNENTRNNLVRAAYVSAILSPYVPVPFFWLVRHGLMIAAYRYPTKKYEIMAAKYDEALKKYNSPESDPIIRKKNADALDDAFNAYKDAEDSNYEGVYFSHAKLIGVSILAVIPIIIVVSAVAAAASAPRGNFNARGYNY